MNLDRQVAVDLDRQELEIWIASLREAPEEAPREEALESTLGVSPAELDEIRNELVSFRDTGTEDAVTVLTSPERLSVVRRCLAVTMDGLGVEEFDTRVGYPWEKGRRVLERLAALTAAES